MKFGLGQDRLTTLIFVQFVVILLLFGGSSRYDSLAQVPVRLSALVLVGWVAATARQPRIPNLPTVAMLGLFAALCVFQLLPLPPELWIRLAGRNEYEAAMAVAGVSKIWRPLNFTPDMGLNTLLSLLPPVAVLAYWSMRPKTDMRTDAMAIVLIALVSAVLGLLQVLTGSDSALRAYQITSRDSAVGLFANRNHQALLLACSLPLLGFIGSTSNFSSRKGKMELGAIAALVTFQLVMVFATGSRAGLLWAAIGLAIAAFFLKRHFRSAMMQASMKLKVTLVLLGAAFAGMIFAFSRSPVAVAVDRMFRSDTATEFRHQIWPTLAEMFWTYFPVGSGFGSFARLYRRFEQPDDLGMSYLNHAHNDLFEFAIEGGVPAMLLALVFAVWWGRQCWRAMTGNSAIAQAGMTIGTMILLASLLDYPLRTPLFACFMTVVCLWMTDQKRRDRGLVVRD